MVRSHPTEPNLCNWKITGYIYTIWLIASCCLLNVRPLTNSVSARPNTVWLPDHKLYAGAFGHWVCSIDLEAVSRGRNLGWSFVTDRYAAVIGSNRTIVDIGHVDYRLNYRSGYNPELVAESLLSSMLSTMNPLELRYGNSFYNSS